MTWIVGRALPWGCAAALSDIRVTLADRSEVDCLQKIYPVGRFIALGFAGSVAIGFGMVGRLRQLLGTVKPGEAWEPDVVAEWWPEDARKVFAAFPEGEQSLGCHLLMAGADEIGSSGSGEVFAEYSQALRKLDERHGFEFLQLEVGQPGGSAIGLLRLISQAVEATPKLGISHHMHVCVARRGEILFGNNNARRGEILFGNNNLHYIGESSGEDIIMPPVAQSYAELGQMLRDRGKALALAMC